MHEDADPENPWAGQGSVLLDIGGEVGALVVTMPAALLGVEVDIRASGALPGAGHHPHVAVVARPAGDGVVPSLVFPELTAGGYTLHRKGEDRVEMTVTVVGGGVTEVVWDPRT